MSLIVTFVRHGQTTKNREQKIQTRTDALLSELGVLQAEALGRKLSDEKYTRVYTSDMKRAVHTAQHILKYNKNSVPNIVQDTRLRERDFGDLEDHAVSEVHDQATQLGIRMFKLITPGGESFEEFAEKGLDFFLELCQLLDNNSTIKENILIGTHGGWILTFLDNLLRNPDKFKVEGLVMDETIRSPVNSSATKIRITKRKTEEAAEDNNEHCYSIQFLSIFDAEHLKGIVDAAVAVV